MDSQGEEEDISEGSGWETASDEEAEGGAEMDEVAAQWQAQEAMAAEVALLQVMRGEAHQHTYHRMRHTNVCTLFHKSTRD